MSALTETEPDVRAANTAAPYRCVPASTRVKPGIIFENSRSRTQFISLFKQNSPQSINRPQRGLKGHLRGSRRLTRKAPPLLRWVRET